MGPDRESTVLNALRDRRVRPKKALANFLSAALRTMGSLLACRNVLLSGALPMGEGRETHSFFLGPGCRKTRPCDVFVLQCRQVARAKKLTKPLCDIYL